MATQTRSVIKNWFRTGLKPVEQQFWDWIDSFWHKSDSIPTASIEGLDAALSSLPTTQQLQAIADFAPKLVSFSGSGTYDIPAGKLLQTVVLEADSTNNMKVGLTSGGNEIDETEVVANSAYTLSYVSYFKVQTTIYFTGNGTAKIYIR